jgi:hypothetical protein
VCQIVNQSIDNHDGFAFMTKFNFDTSGSFLIYEKLNSSLVASNNQSSADRTNRIGKGVFSIDQLHVNPNQMDTAELALFYDDEWFPIYSNSSMTCCDKVQHARITIPFKSIAQVMQTSQFNGSWEIKVSDSERAHIWWIVAANCPVNVSSAQCCTCDPAQRGCDCQYTQGNVTDFWWSGSLTQAQKGIYHQVTYDRQTLFFLYLFFGIVWLVGLAVNVYSSVALARRGAFHPIVRLFTATIVVFECSLITQFIHHAVYAQNGIGLPGLEGFGLFLDLVSDIIFMLLLVLLAQGWAVSRQGIEHRFAMLGGALLFLVLDIILMFCMYFAISPASTAFLFVTAPGIMLLVLRIAILAAFIVLSVRSAMTELDATKKRFYVTLGGVYSVYFVSLPVVALISAVLPAYISYKITMWIYTFIKTGAFGTMLYLLLPSKAEKYFSITQQSLLISAASTKSGYSTL